MIKSSTETDQPTGEEMLGYIQKFIVGAVQLERQIKLLQLLLIIVVALLTLSFGLNSAMLIRSSARERSLNQCAAALEQMPADVSVLKEKMTLSVEVQERLAGAFEKLAGDYSVRKGAPGTDPK